MELTLLFLWLIMWLLCWIFITIGSRRANTLTPRTIAFSGLLSLGVVFALACTIVLAAKIFWLVMMQELDLTLILLLLEVLKSNNSALTVISAGITL